MTSDVQMGARVRSFFTKTGLQPTAMTSAYLESNQGGGGVSSPSESQDQTDCSTKVACAFYGPMQLQAQSAGGAENCQVKVTVEFSDEDKSAFINQLPIFGEMLEVQAANLPTEAITEMQKERKIKTLIDQLTNILTTVLSSAIATENYAGTQIAVNFNVFELDADIVQSLINCASVALLNSRIKCRFLPAAITMMQQASTSFSETKNLIVDPSNKHFQSQNSFAQKIRLVFNVDTEELVYSSMEALQHDKMLDFEEVEKAIGTGLSAARRIHALIRQSAFVTVDENTKPQ